MHMISAVTRRLNPDYEGRKIGINGAIGNDGTTLYMGASHSIAIGRTWMVGIVGDVCYELGQ